MEVAVLGNEEFVLGFRLAGVKRIHTAGPDDYEDRLIELLGDSEIGVLAVRSEDLETIGPTVKARAMESIAPVVVPVGGEEGDLREKVKRAIGVDLYRTERD
ncbi:MAG: V-type ATP synthase subunit F [Methanomassiliicoccales archaeon]